MTDEKQAGAATNGHGHTEARDLFFFEVQRGGVIFHMTLRSGSTDKTVNEMFDLQDYIIGQLQERDGWLTPEARQKTQVAKKKAEATARKRKQPAPKPAQAAKPKAQAKPATPPKNNGQNKAYPPGKFAGRQLKQDELGINRVLVAGTKDAPQVQMFSHNKKLTHPVLRAPSNLVIDILMRGYPGEFEEEDALAMLADVGREIPISWIVKWEESPKDAKWKDIKTITSTKLGEPVDQDSYTADSIADDAIDETAGGTTDDYEIPF